MILISSWCCPYSFPERGEFIMASLLINTEYIKLDQAMKFANVVENGAFAKDLIRDSLVKVNGTVETRRGRKLYEGDSFTFEGETYVIEGAEK